MALASIAALTATLGVPAAGAVLRAASDAGPADHVVRKLASPFDPGANDPAAVAALGSPATPQIDLAAALDSLASAPDAAAAARARQLGLDILEGNPLPARTYSGIPLLNWDPRRKIKTVPAGGNVVVTLVRYGDHALSDTWLLDFADPTRPFTVTYRVSELEPAGVLAPTPLLVRDNLPASSQPAALVPLVLPVMDTGTSVANGFHPRGAPEQTREATQDVTVAMPAARELTAILTPDLRPGHSSLDQLKVLTPSLADQLQRMFGDAGAVPTPADKLRAIGRLSDAAPEKKIWTDLHALSPAGSGFRDAARKVAAGDAPLAAALHDRILGPPAPGPGKGTTPGPADLRVTFRNGEPYISTASLRVAPGAAMDVVVTNQDGFAHQFDTRQLTNRRPALGAVDWGRFDWSGLRADLLGGPLLGGTENPLPISLQPGESRRLTLHPAPDAYEVVLGDASSGDQGEIAVSLDRGPDRQSLAIQPAFAAPSHAAEDSTHNMWVTLEGVDKVIKVTPAPTLADSRIEEYLLPGGVSDFATRLPRQGPHDIAIDRAGIVWVTLTGGNGIARLDPTLVKAGTSEGIKDYFFDACPLCAPPYPIPSPTPPPPVADPPTRDPEQMVLSDGPGGDRLVWFTESLVNAIGVLDVSPDGKQSTYVDFACGCRTPKGIAAAADGSIWFTEQISNRIAKLTVTGPPPFGVAAVHIEHYEVPSGKPEPDPLPSNPFNTVRTSEPHSIVAGPGDRMWFSEEFTGKMGFLDPAKAVAGTSAGITEIDMPPTDFGARAAPADVTVNQAGIVFFADEYGDEVGTVTPAGPGPRWRPTERRSLTDHPIIDHAGNLWFTETGANLLTRIASVGAHPVAGPATAGGDRP